MRVPSRFREALRIGLPALALVVAGTAAEAACLRHVADAPVLLRASFGPGGVPPANVGVTYVGHSSFLLETAGGVKAVTDYNDYVRADVVPDVVTMNNAHSTHYSISVQPGVRHALEGWDSPGREAIHEIVVGDMRIFNVPTNVREYNAVRYNGNSIFVFETAGLCLAHLGHLHHRLTPEHLAKLGQIDVLFVPVDGSWTLNLDSMVEVIEQIRAPVVVPMHFFSHGGLERFLGRLRDKGTSLNYEVKVNLTPSVLLSRATLPDRPEILVLPGH